jgi:hypothetical protein
MILVDRNEMLKHLPRLLYADFDAGLLFWRERNNNDIIRDSRLKSWNSRYANKPALNCLDGFGYLHGRISKVPYKAHRVLWALYYGDWPKNEIDHINRIRTDNRIVNLRDVTSSQNNQNRKIGLNNKTGVIGVCWDVLRGKWKATIRLNHKQTNIGRFDCFEEAVKMRKQKEIDLGFISNEGV